MLNPVQGVKTFEAKHPKAAKAAKIGAAAVAIGAVAVGSAYRAYKGQGEEVIASFCKSNPDATKLTKLGEGFKILGSKAQKAASRAVNFAKEVPSKVANLFSSNKADKAVVDKVIDAQA